jgi:hypothetical protein
MRLTVLGCAGSFPGPESACSAYLVEAEGFRLLIDYWLPAGKAFPQLMFPLNRSRISLRGDGVVGIREGTLSVLVPTASPVAAGTSIFCAPDPVCPFRRRSHDPPHCLCAAPSRVTPTPSNQNA